MVSDSNPNRYHHHPLSLGGDSDSRATERASELDGIAALRAQLDDDRPWRRDALCREHPEVDFFPSKGEANRPALEVCGHCAVMLECRAWAVADPSLDHGILGGMTARARSGARRAASTRPTTGQTTSIHDDNPSTTGSTQTNADQTARTAAPAAPADPSASHDQTTNHSVGGGRSTGTSDVDHVAARAAIQPCGNVTHQSARWGTQPKPVFDEPFNATTNDLGSRR